MARQEIILGPLPAGLGGDPPRTASMKINAMTQELYDKHAALGTASVRAAQTVSKAVSGELLRADLNGIGMWRDLRNTLYLTGTPRDINSSGTTIGFGDAGVLGIPGYLIGTYGVLHSNIHFPDPSGAGAISQSFEMQGETWRRVALNLDTWQQWLLVGGRTQYVGNGEGEAWLYADGTMMATAFLSGTGYSITVPSYRTWTFPRAFVGNAPKVSLSISRASLDNTMVTGRTYTPELTRVQMAHSGTSAAGCDFACMAFGRWK